MPEGWCWTTIGEVSSSILYGVSESAKETGAYKLLRITDIQDNKVNWDSVPHTDFDKEKALNYLLQDGDILFARTGATVGKSYLVSGLAEESIYASYLIRVQTSQLIFPEYIKRFFESGYYWEQITLSSVGIGQPNVNGTTLANLNVPIPPYKEQLRIVEETNRWLAIADILDENTGHVCKAIESAKAKILDLAIHGKLVPQEPNDEPASVLLKRVNPKAVASCDNPHYENVPFVIPSSWAWCKVRDVADVARGGSPRPIKQYLTESPDGVNWIKISDAEEESKYISKTTERIIPDGVKKSRYVKVGDFLLTNSMSFGKPYILGTDGCIHDGWLVISPIDGAYDKNFLYYLLSSSFAYNQFSEKAGGAVVSNLNKDKVADSLFPLPPLAEQKRIASMVEELYSSLEGIASTLQ